MRSVRSQGKPRRPRAPRSFGETVQARESVATTAQRLIDIAVALPLLGRVSNPADVRFE
jgi:hypothetical protein